MASGFKKWREDTSTSPSQRHLGNYKYLLKPDGQKSKNKLNDFNTTKRNVHNTIINSDTTTGILLKRWTLLDVIILEREPNNPRINRLRVIKKYEVDFNLALTLFWTRLEINYLESLNLLGETNVVRDLTIALKTYHYLTK